MNKGSSEKVAKLRSGLVLQGLLTHEIQYKGDGAWWVFIRGDVEVDGRRDENLVLHHMTIYISKRKVGAYGNYQFVGKYSLRPIKKFREILGRYLKSMLSMQITEQAVRKGIVICLEELEGYSDAKTMKEEVQKALNNLDLSRSSSLEILRAILQELRETSVCDVPFVER